MVGCSRAKKVVCTPDAGCVWKFSRCYQTAKAPTKDPRKKKAAKKAKKGQKKKKHCYKKGKKTCKKPCSWHIKRGCRSAGWVYKPRHKRVKVEP
jgi:hypothetical protein